MKINEVEAAVGVTKKNIRFYEEEGLITPGREPGNGYRSYSQTDVERLRRIKCNGYHGLGSLHRPAGCPAAAAACGDVRHPGGVHRGHIESSHRPH